MKQTRRDAVDFRRRLAGRGPVGRHLHASPSFADVVAPLLNIALLKAPV
jgi:hypothetical protein